MADICSDAEVVEYYRAPDITYIEMQQFYHFLSLNDKIITVRIFRYPLSISFLSFKATSKK